MNGVSLQRNYCLETWISCENLLAALQLNEFARKEQLVKVVDECAHICMETWQALNSRSASARKLILLCIGICTECAEICKTFPQPQIQQCAAFCQRCGDSFAKLAATMSEG